MRRPEYAQYSQFASKQNNRCSRCGASLPKGAPVLGGKPFGDQWDIVCLQCGGEADGSAASRGSDPAPRGSAGKSAPAAGSASGSSAASATVSRGAAAVKPALSGSAPRTPWSTLVEYLRDCVLHETAAKPVELSRRGRWSPLPLGAETVLCGGDQAVPELPEIQELTRDLKDMEVVYYGWPTVVVLDETGRPSVAPLFLRQLDTNPLSPETITDLGDPASMLSSTLDAVTASTGMPLNLLRLAKNSPRFNTALLSREWFDGDLVAAAHACLPDGPLGFGWREAVLAAARAVLSSLELPADMLDPSALLDPSELEEELWRPQEPGVFNVTMAFVGETDLPTRNLVQDLAQMARSTDWQNSAARFLFEVAPHVPANPASNAMGLNAPQTDALASTVESPLTVISGPPGTGKSQTVAAMMADAWLRGETALLASTNNQPVDSVVEEKAKDLIDALALRTGNKPARGALANTLKTLPEDVGVRVQEDHDADAGDLETARSHHVVATRLLHETGKHEAEVLRWSRECEAAVERLAVPDVDDYHARRCAHARWGWWRRWRARRVLRQTGSVATREAVETLLNWGSALAKRDDAYAALHRFQHQQPRDPYEGFTEAHEGWDRVSKQAVRERIGTAVEVGRDVIAELATKLNQAQEKRLDAMRDAMRYLKGWATSALSTRPSFRCAAGTIDLVIIDEASQCTLAHVLPLVYRAKRLVIVGDEQQLGPVVTADERDLRALAPADLPYETLRQRHHTFDQDSAYSAFVPNAPREHLLDEHFRCHPEIIDFCNAEFYGHLLHVLTAVDRNGPGPTGLEWQEVEGATEPGPTGSRRNPTEAEEVADWIASADLERHSVGVVTPFRAQEALIRQRLRARGISVGDGGVSVGTTHRFQGGERPVMLFSTVLARGANPGSASWLEGERNLINVAVSRAKRYLLVFGNRGALHELGATTLVALAEAARRERQADDSALTDAVWRLHAALVRRGLRAELGGTYEGYPMAITVAVPGGERVNVEVTEYPEAESADHARLRRRLGTRDETVARLGRRVVRVAGWRCYLEPDATAEELATAFEN